MKKIFSLLALAVFFLSGISVFAITFADVASDHENITAIKYLENKGIISGYPDGTFKPGSNISRAEATKIIVNAFNIDHAGNYEVIFPDVKKDSWFFSFVMGAKSAGLIKGFSDGTFKPENTVTLAETLKIAFIAANFTLPDSVSENAFLDVNKDEWYAVYALYGRNRNIVMGDDSGKLNAGKEMTRGEFAEIIYRTLIVQELKEKEFPIDQNWPVYESSSLDFKMKYNVTEFSVIAHDDEVIFWKKDLDNHQSSYGRIYPNSAIVRVAVDNNPDSLSYSDYLSNLKTAFSGAKFTEFTFKNLKAVEVLYSEKRIVDWYLFLPNNKVTTVYTEYGNGPIGYKIQKYIKAMLNSWEYSENSIPDEDDYSALLNEIFGNILVEGKGMEMLNKLPDKLIFETDSLGVGTGPVDYYYSEKVNYTFKYERASDVLLDKREGKTSAF